MSDITILTVSWRSAAYLENLLANLRTKAAAPQCLRPLIIDNTNGSDPQLDQLAAGDGTIHVVPLDSQGLRSSRAHAHALNHAMDLLDTEYTLVTDPDVHVFKRDWDRFCIEQLQAHDAVAVGTTYPKWMVGKYHDWPSPIFMFFRTKAIRSLSEDWTPYARNPLERMCAFVERQISRWGGYLNRRRLQNSPTLRRYAATMERLLGVCSLDTGWRLAAAARKARTQAVLFDAVTPSETHRADESPLEPFTELATHYELYCHHNEPILTHKYSTAGPLWHTPKSADTKHWRECIREFER